MSKPFFVYTIYIASTPEKVFKAIRSAAAAVLHVPLDARTFLRGRAALARRHRSRKAESKVIDAISKGWPLVLSSLKSYLEANRVLYAPWYEKEPVAAS